MTLKETMREQRLIERRARGRKARLIGRLIGFGLTACALVAVRTEPQLRQLVEQVALSAIGAGQTATQDAQGASSSTQQTAIAALGYDPAGPEAATLKTLGISGDSQPSRVQTGQLPVSRVKVNRGGVAPSD